MQRKILTLSLLLIFSLLAACTAAETQPPVQPTSAPTDTAAPVSEAISLIDGRGVAVELEGPAQRIISLAPSNTEILFAVGAGEQVIGRDSFSDYPAEALAITDIGGGFGELDIETLLSLEPDLVLSADIIAPEQNQALVELGLPVFVLPNPVELDGLYTNLDTVGALTGHPQAAAEAAAAFQARVEAVLQEVAAARDRPLVFYQLDSSDPNAPWTSGPGTFIDTLIKMAGGENVGDSLDGAWAQISVEALIALNPDVILMGDALYSGLTSQDVAARPGWDAIAAVQSGQIYEFDDNLASRPGPRLVDGLEQIARLLHPDLFKE
jgi:iron complex transport system substrate-binding protein